MINHLLLLLLAIHASSAFRGYVSYGGSWTFDIKSKTDDSAKFQCFFTICYTDSEMKDEMRRCRQKMSDMRIDGDAAASYTNIGTFGKKEDFEGHAFAEAAHHFGGGMANRKANGVDRNAVCLLQRSGQNVLGKSVLCCRPF